MSLFVIILGLVIALIGLIFPIPGPLDDPVDFIGYLMMALGIVKKIFEAILPGKDKKT